MIHVVLTANKIMRGAQTLLDSMGLLGVEPVILGLHQPYEHTRRNKWIYEWVADYRYTDDYVVYMDAFDTVLARDPQFIVDEYLRVGCSMLFNAEKMCYPHPTLAQYYKTTREEYPYLNSGMFVASCKELYKQLADARVMEYPDAFDDQEFWTIRYFNPNNRIALDHSANVLQTLYGCEDHLEYRYCGIHNHVMDTYPSAFHGNGFAKLDDVISWVLGPDKVEVHSG